MSFHLTGQSSISKKISNIPRNLPQIIISLVRERAFLPSFSARCISGSLTIEASLALPIFIFFSVCIVHFLLLISLQGEIQVRLEETARDMGKNLYITSDSETAALAAANPLTVRAGILNDELSQRIDNSCIRGGASGLSTFLTSYDYEIGILDIVVTYTYDFPYLPEGIGAVSFMQRCRSRAWIGRELSEGKGGESKEDETEHKTVYITPTGSAYHTSTSCPYLDLSIHSVDTSLLDSSRNASGGKYGKCSCALEGASSYYVTDYGILYHSDLSCSNLKRTVQAVDITEVGGRHLCSKCAATGE